MPEEVAVQPGLAQMGAVAPAPMRTGALRRWAAGHEDSWLFTLLYVGLAVTLSLLVSLFWLVVLVAIHFLLEWVALEPLHQRFWARVRAATWAVKLDVALLLFAFALTLYLETLFGILGLRSAATVSAAARATGRFATLERTVRGILLSLDDAAYVARAVLARTPKARRTAELQRRHTELVAATRRPHRTGIHWTTGDRIAIALLLAVVVLLAGAPWLTQHSVASALHALGRDLRPW